MGVQNLQQLLDGLHVYLLLFARQGGIREV